MIETQHPMASAQVQRTLVKSPPELWAELSDPAALARHLGDLGEIRITRIEPEQKVEWQADATSGAVMIKPTGWGTRVTLTATLQADEVAEPAIASASAIVVSSDAPSAQADDPPTSHADAPAIKPDPEPPLIAPKPVIAADRSGIEAEPLAQKAGEPMTLQPQPARELHSGRFRRVLAKLRGTKGLEAPAPAAEGGPLENAADAKPPAAEPTQPVSEASAWESWLKPAKPAASAAFAPSAPPGAETSALESPLVPAASAPLAPPAGEACAGTSAVQPGPPPAAATHRPDEVEPQAAQSGERDVESVLSAVLDSLGSAHHRPFSRP